MPPLHFLAKAEGEISMSNPMNVPEHVKNLYSRYPFPGPGMETEIVENFKHALAFLRISEEELKDAVVMDAGCGTGIVAMYLASVCKEVKAFDMTEASLEQAQSRAEQSDIKNIEFRCGSVFDVPYKDQSFDLVVSRGVLHHTEDAYGGFQNIVETLRPGGRILVSLYHKFGRYRHRLRRAKVSKLAGDDVEKRTEVAKQLYFADTPDSEIERIETLISDQYAHPHETYHTGGEVLRWFQRHGIEYTASYFPIFPAEYFELSDLLFPPERIQRSSKHRLAYTFLNGMKTLKIDKLISLLGGNTFIGRVPMELSFYLFNIQYFYMTGIRETE